MVNLSVDKNVFIRIPETIHGNINWVDFTCNNLVTDKDPGFVNEENQNFMLKSNSEVFEKIKGFVPIPFDKIGIHKQNK